MTKTYKILMMLFLLFLWGSGLKALDQKDGVYQIGTADDLVAFSELVNGGEYAASAALTADIDLSGISYFPPIGKQHWPQGPLLSFDGIFDGQGHIIYNLRIEKDDPGAETGLFGRLNGATIQNLGIVNATLKNSNALRAGVLGACAVNSKIINCFTTGNIVTDGCVCSNNYINGGGLIGLLTSESAISNSYTTYNTLGDDEYSIIENCYWGEEAVAGAPTGELCYKLNGDQSVITWYQNLSEDSYPSLDNTHKQVYLMGDYKCDGTPASDKASYTNDKEAAGLLPPHTYVDGVCTECGHLDPGYVQLVDGWYEVSTSEQLLYISELVNSGKYDINVRLTANIDLSGISYFPPIGKQYFPQGPALSFDGIFDGQGHIIYNLRIEKDDPGAETGLFGRLNGATIQNVGIVNATLKNSNALRAGVLGACAVNSKIINCFTTGNIETNECICSFNYTNGGGLIGLLTSESAISNSYTTYNTLGDDEYSIIENCYWGEEAVAGAPTGELCYKLNGDRSIITWYQKLGEDAYPVLNAERGTVIPNEDGNYENATGIQQIADKKQTGQIFNLMGQKMQKVTKGIYIIDGKKTLVK